MHTECVPYNCNPSRVALDLYCIIAISPARMFEIFLFCESRARRVVCIMDSFENGLTIHLATYFVERKFFSFQALRVGADNIKFHFNKNKRGIILYLSNGNKLVSCTTNTVLSLFVNIVETFWTNIADFSPTKYLKWLNARAKL